MNKKSKKIKKSSKKLKKNKKLNKLKIHNYSFRPRKPKTKLIM